MHCHSFPSSLLISFYIIFLIHRHQYLSQCLIQFFFVLSFKGTHDLGAHTDVPMKNKILSPQQYLTILKHL